MGIAKIEGDEKMSQEKVNQYKEAKKNRKEIEKKAKHAQNPDPEHLLTFLTNSKSIKIKIFDIECSLSLLPSSETSKTIALRCIMRDQGR